MMKTIAETIDSLQSAARNGETIRVASRRRLVADGMLALRKHANRVLKR